ncbi:Tlg2-vesicle protein [Aspergillus nanangensis]|uniref:Golgi apparatus membrane protein TVP38 n=1 Tax=Aspergillus nanangensis TaxID=2582783 RepID=A0AAD4CSP3_ASPNN|nr:Tlg2-vesicle protein [Aspergillus nanangensis]
MPADYTSTARALSLSTSPLAPLSPSEEDDAYRPWRNLAASRRDSTNRSIQEPTSFRDKLLHRKVFIWLKPVAEEWEHNPLVYFVLWLCVFFVSFPPLVGWSTFGTVAGYIFGVWHGWLLYATATVLGSTCSFIASRTILSKFVNRLMERDKRFAALSLTLKYDGLKLLCMIRLCPLPYSICNGAVSTFPTVHPLMYGLATAIITPKLLVPAFIGSRIRLLSEKGGEMSAGSKAVNICSIILTIAVGIFTGWYIYRRTLARAKELEAQEREDIRRTLQADHAAHRPHHAFSEDHDTNVAATTLARDEEERIGFHDFDDDNVDLVIDDESGSDNSPKRYQDEFTDNDSDVFRDGDGTEGETYTLHTHVQKSSRS